MWVAFALQKLLTFFQQKFQHICVSLDVNVNESSTNDVVSFEQLGPVFFVFHFSSTDICCMVWVCMAYEDWCFSIRIGTPDTKWKHAAVIRDYLRVVLWNGLW